MVIRLSELEKAVNDCEKEADALLAGAGRQRARGVYSESALNRKIRREDERKAEPRQVGLPDEVCEYLLLAHLRELISSPRLTSIERQVVILSTVGWEIGSAARRLRISRSRYYKLLKSARKKAAAYSRNPYAGWYEVYLAEVNRYVYKKRRTPGSKSAVHVEEPSEH